MFFAAVAFFLCVTAPHAVSAVGEIYVLHFTDLDGRRLSTADGHHTVLVIANSEELDRAREVGARIPDYCLGNPDYRMVTVIEFASNHSLPVRALIEAVARRRLEAEARNLQTRYDRLQIKRDARGDVFAAVDFDGSIAAHLAADSKKFQVLVLGQNGELAQHWSDVPTEQALAAALKGND